MEIFFNNDGSYGQSALHIPVLFNGCPIGFVSSVTAEKVTCYLWDRFITREQIGCNFGDEQDIISIGVKMKG